MIYWPKLLVFQFPGGNGCKGLSVTSRVLLTLKKSLSVHQTLNTSVHISKSAKGVLLAEGGEGDVGEFWLCRQKRLDPGSYGRKKPPPVKVCTLNSLRGQNGTTL